MFQLGLPHVACSGIIYVLSVKKTKHLWSRWCPLLRDSTVSVLILGHIPHLFWVFIQIPYPLAHKGIISCPVKRVLWEFMSSWRSISEWRGGAYDVTVFGIWQFFGRWNCNLGKFCMVFGDSSTWRRWKFVISWKTSTVKW